MDKNIKKGGNMSILDMPEMILDIILKRLSPIELCTMSEVCTCLRDRCQSDHLWEKHVKHKWGRVIGDAAYKEWQLHITTAQEGNQRNNQNGSLGSFTGDWPNLCFASYLQDCSLLNGQRSNHFMMSMYFSLQSGRFWFPAQVRKGLSIQNALVSYVSESNTFQARCQYGGWGCLGKNLEWDMVRIPAVDTPPYALHVSDCLDDLKPGDHIEIQLRGNPQAPYAWWYAVISHLDSCNENENYCQCHHSDMLIVEFMQCPRGSNMGRITLSRINGEQGDRLRGFCGVFYGGIRKLHREDEIETWKKLFPRQTQLAPGYFIPQVAAQFPVP